MSYVVVLVNQTPPFVHTDSRDIKSFEAAAERVADEGRGYDWFFIMETTTWSIVRQGVPSALADHREEVNPELVAE